VQSAVAYNLSADQEQTAGYRQEVLLPAEQEWQRDSAPSIHKKKKPLDDADIAVGMPFSDDPMPVQGQPEVFDA